MSPSGEVSRCSTGTDQDFHDQGVTGRMADNAPDSALRGFERSLPIALLRAREATMRRFKPHVDAHGLTLQQWRVIRALADHGPMDATTLAEKCVILPPSLSRIFRTLEDRGLVAPVKARDARRHTVELTEAGCAIHARMAGRSEEIYREIEDTFGREKMTQLLELLSELRSVAQRLQAEEDAPQERSTGPQE